MRIGYKVLKFEQRVNLILQGNDNSTQILYYIVETVPYVDKHCVTLNLGICFS